MRFVGKLILLFLVVQLMAVEVWSQSCNTRGQTPSTAFPVCGATTFTQLNVPLCSNASVPSYCETGQANTQPVVNPFWYKFTCYASGTLAFLITPLNTADEDYDWQLFDVTGHNPNDVFTDRSLVVTNNWSGTYGPTGASSAGARKYQCGTNPPDNINTFALMPTLIQGHEYLLLISHFLLPPTTSEVGYKLSFSGGTASIVNPVVPKLATAEADCEGRQIGVKLASRINCSSIAADGSDFNISGTTNRNFIAASGYGCQVGFDTDSLVLSLSTPLPTGNFAVNAKLGSDANTLNDNCGNEMVVGDKTNFSFTALQPTSFDSISPVICIQDTLQLIFSKPIFCNSIAADGSDFAITGPANVAVKTAFGNGCVNGLSKVVKVVLTNQIRVDGTFTVTLKAGTDNNTIVDACSLVSVPKSVSFTTKNITTADFTGTVATGCKSDTVYFKYSGYGNPTQFNWSLDGAALSTAPNPSLISRAFGPHTTMLSVNNGFCSDTARTQFTFIDNTVKAGFMVSDTLCPSDTLHFTNTSSSNASSWMWNFGNGVTSTLSSPPAQSYPLRGRQVSYTARLSVTNNLNCADTTYKLLTVLASCYIAVPSAFTPNGDGLNDYLYPLNAFKADNMMFRIFNRYGQILFQTSDWTKKWDGRYNYTPQPSGTYVWMLDYTDRDNGKKVSLKGTTVLIR